MRKKALISALSARAQNGSISIAEFDKVENKTGKMAKALQKMALKKPLTMVYTENEVWRVCRNIADLNLVAANQTSAYHVLLGNSLIITPRALEALEVRLKETK